MTTDSEVRFVWLDLEMTGLNVASDYILEIAAIVTGPSLQPLAEVERVLHLPEEALADMSARVRRMHTDNGLLDAVRASTTILAQAERDVLKVVSQHCPPGQAMLCGSSVHQDRRFLSRYMPRLDQHLHFHTLDIATISVLVNAWYPDRKLEENFDRPVTRHRAMADVRASLEEMRYYCRNAFGVKLEALAPALRSR